MNYFFQKKKRFSSKGNNKKKKKLVLRKGQQKFKKATRTIVKKKAPVSRSKLRTKQTRAALKIAEGLRAEERSQQAANMVYGNEENIGIR